MSDLRRLKDGDGGMASLLRSAVDDGPSPASRRAIAAAIGVGAGAALAAGTTSSAAAASAASGGAASGGAVASVGAKASISIVAKLVVGLALVTGIGVAVNHATSSPAPTMAVTPTMADTPMPTTRPPNPVTPTAAIPSAEGSEVVAAPSREDVQKQKPAKLVKQTPSIDGAAGSESIATKDEHVAKQPATNEAAAPVPALADEVKLLDQALGALRRKEGRAALLVLERYASKFPHGSLAPEATVARIQALQLDSQPDEARKVGTEFLSEHGDSPLAARVRRMIDAP